MPEWIKGSNRLPAIDEQVLIYNGEIHKGFRMDWDNERGWFWTHYDCMETYGVTHWMPLPKPPYE